MVGGDMPLSPEIEPIRPATELSEHEQVQLRHLDFTTIDEEQWMFLAQLDQKISEAITLLVSGVVSDTVDLGGRVDALILDADGDTTISAPTDDQIDFEIGGADDFSMTANSFNVLTGSVVKLADITQGSTLFVGASGVVSQDNANFFYDATNHVLGLGTATPYASTVLHCYSDVANSTVGLWIQNANAAGTSQIAIGKDLTTEFFEILWGSADSHTSLYNVANGWMRFGTNNTERMKLNAAGGLTMANGNDISLEEAINFTGANNVNFVKFPDNLAVALAFKEGDTSYMQFITTDGSESISMMKTLKVDVIGEYTGAAGVTIDGVLLKDTSITADKLILNNTSEPAITISMTSITGTDNQAIDIVGGEALDAEEHWTGIRIKPDDLDPTGADTRIRGVAINMSGIDTSNSFESLDGLRIKMPKYWNNSCAIDIAEGQLCHFYTTGAVAAKVYTAQSVVVDAADLHANSEVHLLDVVAAGGIPAGDVVGLGTHGYISPICQHIGTFSTPNQTEYAGRKTGGGVTWADGIDGIEVFVQNADEVYIGSATQFAQIEVIMTTSSTKTTSPTFWYNTAADTWTQFYPSDTTEGYQQSGIIDWTLAAISALWTNDGDPGAGDSSAGYWIKIIRTAAPDPGTPTPTTMKTGTTTLYKWDADGDLNIHDLAVAGTLGVTGVTTFDADVYLDSNKLWMGAAGSNYYLWDGSAVEARLGDNSEVWNWDTTGIHLVDGKALYLQEGINFLGATTENQIIIPDNLADALSVQEGANKYMTFVTTNGSEAVTLHKVTTLADASTLATSAAPTADAEIANKKYVDDNAGIAAHAILDGSVHTDSVADAVTRGSLIYGNATPKWDELVIGTGVLTGDGTDVAWATEGYSTPIFWDMTTAAPDVVGQGTWISDVAGTGSCYVQNSSGNDGDNFTCNFRCPAGTYTLRFNAFLGTNAGIVDVYVDASEEGSFDLEGAADILNVEEITGLVLAAGAHTLKFQLDGTTGTDHKFFHRAIWLQRTA